MKLEVFTALIETIEAQVKRGQEIAKLGIDLFDYEEGWINATMLALSVYYGKAGGDWIFWYLYERTSPDGKVVTAKNAQGEAICYNISSLWDFVEKLRVADDFIEFAFPEKTTITLEDVNRLFTNPIGTKIG